MRKESNRIKVVRNYEMAIAGKTRIIPEVRFGQSRADSTKDIISHDEFEKIMLHVKEEILNSNETITSQEIDHIIQTLSNVSEKTCESIRLKFEETLKIDFNIKNQIKQNNISKDLSENIKSYFKNMK